MTRWLLPVLLLAGCAKHPRAVYQKALDQQTEMRTVYEGMGTALRIRATYLSSSFRSTLADERARLLGPAADDHADFKARLLEDARTYHEVVFTTNSSLLDPEVEVTGDDEGWRIRLEADGEEQPLVTVYRIEELSPLHESLYAYWNIWSELWIAKFERTVEAPAEVSLHIGSGYGHQTVTWDGEQLR